MSGGARPAPLPTMVPAIEPIEHNDLITAPSAPPVNRNRPGRNGGNSPNPAGPGKKKKSRSGKNTRIALRLPIRVNLLIYPGNKGRTRSSVLNEKFVLIGIHLLEYRQPLPAVAE